MSQDYTQSWILRPLSQALPTIHLGSYGRMGFPKRTDGDLFSLLLEMDGTTGFQKPVEGV